MMGTGERILVAGATGFLGRKVVQHLLHQGPNRRRWQAAESVKPVVFLDFDGTITRRDVTDAILETYADPQWLRVEEEWKAGRMSSRECLTAQVALVTATQEELDFLLDDIEIDDGFVPLLETCSAHSVPAHIVSDGFDYCIQRILSRPSLQLAPYLKGVQIVSSHLEPLGTRWTVEFTSSCQPCVHGCATCKPAAMARLNTTGGPTIFVGDGLSDKYAAARADLVFAKDKLAAFCDAQAISYAPYDNLATIARLLDRLIQSNAALARESSDKAGD
jgi:2-hydroxy-3-keto-5-methylthiopentenyl-1-phosphate phosphatase